MKKRRRRQHHTLTISAMEKLIIGLNALSKKEKNYCLLKYNKCIVLAMLVMPAKKVVP